MRFPNVSAPHHVGSNNNKVVGNLGSGWWWLVLTLSTIKPAHLSSIHLNDYVFLVNGSLTVGMEAWKTDSVSFNVICAYECV